MSKQHRRLWQYLKRILTSSLLILTVWLGSVGISIWRFGTLNQATQANCIIVLGAAIQGHSPSPVFAERIRHGVNLYQAGLAPKIIFTGGFGEGQTYSESLVAAMFAEDLGVPADDLLMETRSRTTRQNLVEATAIMKQQGWDSAIIVSDPLHMKRATTMASDLGLEASSSPTPTSRYRSLKTQLGFLMREIYFFHHYLVTGN